MGYAFGFSVDSAGHERIKCTASSPSQSHFRDDLLKDHLLYMSPITLFTSGLCAVVDSWENSSRVESHVIKKQIAKESYGQ